MHRRLASALGALALAAVALTGCATGAADPDLGSQAGAAPEPDRGSLDVGAAWLAGGAAVGVVTQGSSSPGCAPRVEDAVADSGVLVVTLSTDPAAACTRDLVPRGTLVMLPEGLDAADGLDIQVTLDEVFGETSLEAFAGSDVEDYSPSAGWVDDGVVAVLTWGSSSCAPVVEAAVAESETSVVVTFAKVAADQVCTMDMAPRVAIATIEGEVSRDAQLSFLGGDTLPGLTIPIS